jgi:UDP-N-acetylmuramate--alanine ligase
MLSPTVTIVTNIDREHLSNYRDFEHLKETFLTFINRVPFSGASILCLDDPQVQNLVPLVKKRFVTYGLSAQAEVTAKDIKTLDWGHRFDWYRKGERLGEITVNMPGRHNVLNALAASAVGLELGLAPQVIAEGIAGLKGVGRRFELKGQAGGIDFLDDYAHHPSEVLATLATLAECYPDRRKVVLFQPHRHTRTKELFDEFVKAFNQVEILFLADIYSAGEPPFENLDSQVLAKAIASHGHRGVEYLGPANLMTGKVKDRLRPGDVVMTMGAGNIWQVGEELLKRFSD